MRFNQTLMSGVGFLFLLFIISKNAMGVLEEVVVGVGVGGFTEYFQ